MNLKLKLKQSCNQQSCQRLFILFFCIFALTSCGENRKELPSTPNPTPSSSTTSSSTSSSTTTSTTLDDTLQVTGLEENDTTPAASKELSWDCNNSPCEFRFIVKKDDEEHIFPENHEYESKKTITVSIDDPDKEEGTYYLHVQAKDSEGNASEVETMSFILKLITTFTLIDPTPQTEILPFYENKTPTIQVSGKGVGPGQEVQLYSSSNCNDSDALSDAITVPTDASSVDIIINKPLHLGAHNIYAGTKAPQDSNTECSAESLSYTLYNPIATGFELSCHLSTAGSVRCWGEGENGQAGYEVTGNTKAIGDEDNEMGQNLKTVELGTDKTAKFITVGDNPTGTTSSELNTHVCAVLNDDTVKCWGGNNFGQLGLGDTGNRGNDSTKMGDNLPIVDLGTDRTAKVISAGEHYTCAILDNNEVKCWGKNDKGQLGLGHTDTRGNEMGQDLEAVDLGEDGGVKHTAKAIATGKKHVCAILDNDKVKCWGENHKGQLGLDDTNDRGDGDNEMGDTLLYVNLGEDKTAKAIVASYSHTCVILDDDKVKCWGENHKGQLGLGDTNDRGGNSGDMAALQPIELGTDKTAKAIAANVFYTCAILNDDSVTCWGENHVGQLGLGNTDNIGDGNNEMGQDLKAVDLGADSGTMHTAKTIATGWSQSCAILNDDRLKCWGCNNKGQLGLGHSDNIGDGLPPPGEDEMGDNLPYVDLGL